MVSNYPWREHSQLNEVESERVAGCGTKERSWSQRMHALLRLLPWDVNREVVDATKF